MRMSYTHFGITGPPGIGALFDTSLFEGLEGIPGRDGGWTVVGR